MRRYRNALAWAVVLVSLTGCAATLWWGKKQTTLRFGMTQQQVQTLLGPPQQVMSQQLQDMMVETWKYLDRTVTFHNGIVYSWNTQP